MKSYRIKKIDIRGSRVKTVVDGREDPIILPLDIFESFNIKTGDELSDTALTELVDEADYYQCRNSAVRILSYRGHSTGEMRVKLLRKGFSSKIIKQTLAYLHKQKYLDDKQYAQKLALKLVENKPSGRSVMIGYLRKKMIDRNTAETTVAEVLESVDMTNQALLALEKRWGRYRDLELEEAKKKSYTYLSRRGFGFEAAKNAFNILNKRTEEE